MCGGILDDTMSVLGSSHQTSYVWKNFWVFFDTNLILNSLPVPLNIFFCYISVFIKDKDSNWKNPPHS